MHRPIYYRIGFFFFKWFLAGSAHVIVLIFCLKLFPFSPQFFLSPCSEFHLRRLHSQTSPLLPALLTRRLLDTTHPATLYKLPPRNPLRPRPLVLWLRLVPVKALLPFSHFLQFTCDSNSLLFSVPSAETPAPARQGAPACLPHST